MWPQGQLTNSVLANWLRLDMSAVEVMRPVHPLTDIGNQVVTRTPLLLYARGL